MYRIENDTMIAEFSTKGAECHRLYNKKTNIDYLWSGNEQFWARHAPILFPIIGRLKHNTYIFDEKSYEMNAHGFARDSIFTVFRQTKTMISFVLKSDEKTKENYPFDFSLKITYTLVDNELNVSYQVDNHGPQPMYFNIGGHPGFNIPYNGGDFSDYRLTMKTETPCSRYFVSEDGLIQTDPVLTDAPFDLRLTHDLFEHDALIYQTEGETSIYLHHIHDKHYIELYYDHIPFVGIWSPYPKRAPFVCIEPWFGMADKEDTTGNFIHKAAIQKVDSHDYWRCQYTIKCY